MFRARYTPSGIGGSLQNLTTKRVYYVVFFFFPNPNVYMQHLPRYPIHGTILFIQIYVRAHSQLSAARNFRPDRGVHSRYELVVEDVGGHKAATLERTNWSDLIK